MNTTTSNPTSAALTPRRRGLRLIAAATLLAGVAATAAVAPAFAASPKVKKLSPARAVQTTPVGVQAASGNPPTCPEGEVLRWAQNPPPGHYYCAAPPTTTTAAPKQVSGWGF